MRHKTYLFCMSLGGPHPLLKKCFITNFLDSNEGFNRLFEVLLENCLHVVEIWRAIFMDDMCLVSMRVDFTIMEVLAKPFAGFTGP